jgi:uncharacterized protein (DUF2252 family)
MNIIKATRSYEEWLGGHLRLVPEDLRLKHDDMADSFFAFFRGAFYRWAQCWPQWCAPLADAPEVVAVGDLHVENFGTWRDPEGRLIWGINDFDEAFPMACTNDLTRLLASVLIACPEGKLKIQPKVAADIILESYRNGLRAGGCPFVLAEDQTPLREMARNRLRDPEKFWRHLRKQPTIRAMPRSARKALLAALPESGEPIRFARRVAGIGSLGHERFIAIALHQGGRIAREVKSRAPSACVWAGSRGKKDYYRRLIERAVRCGDPFLKLTDDWVVRRLSPDCCRLQLADLPERCDVEALLLAMGWETANIHLASRNPAAILKCLRKVRPVSLNQCATDMVNALHKDWKRWQAQRTRPGRYPAGSSK